MRLHFTSRALGVALPVVAAVVLLWSAQPFGSADGGASITARADGRLTRGVRLPEEGAHY